jgi:hypothetical protein
MRFFVNCEQVFAFGFTKAPSDEIQIVQALNVGWDEGSVENGEFSPPNGADLNCFNISCNHQIRNKKTFPDGFYSSLPRWEIAREFKAIR